MKKLILLILLPIIISGCTLNNRGTNTSIDNQDTVTNSKEVNTKDWQTYTNSKYKFYFKYPSNFLVEELAKDNSGTLVYLKVFDGKAKNFEGENTPGYFTYMTVSYWDDVNNEYAKGGGWVGQRHYSNLEDIFTDDKAPIRKKAKIEFAGIKAYEVLVGGYSTTYGIMFEYNNGVYRVDFPDEIQHKPTTSIRDEIISTFKVLSNAQASARDKCIALKGTPRFEPSMLHGEEQIFCSFGTEEECTQGELNTGQCFKEK